MLSWFCFPRRFFGAAVAPPAAGSRASATPVGLSSNSRSPWAPWLDEEPRATMRAFPPDFAAIPTADWTGSFEILAVTLGLEAARAGRLALARAFGLALARALGRALAARFGFRLLAEALFFIFLALPDLPFLPERFPAMEDSSVGSGPTAFWWRQCNGSRARVQGKPPAG